MKGRSQIRTLLRLLFLFAVLLAIAVVSAVTTIRFTIHGRQETLPNLVGLPLSQARKQVAALGLNLKVEDRLYSSAVASGAVAQQMPAAGTHIKPLQFVHVLVSLGPPQVAVPDLIGNSLRAARITAVQRGLTIGDVAALYWPKGDPNDVVAQDPPPATTDLQRPALDFLVSLGQEPAAFLCPSFVGKPLGVVRAELEQAGFQDFHVTRVPSSEASPDTILVQAPFAGTRVTPDTSFDFQVAQ